MSLGFNINRPGRGVSNSMLGSVTASSVIMAPSNAQFARSNVKQNVQAVASAPTQQRSNVTRNSIHADAITSRRLDYVETQVKQLTTAVHEAKSAAPALPPTPAFRFKFAVTRAKQNGSKKQLVKQCL